MGGEGAPEVLLCLCGKHGDCTDEIFSENCQRMANRLIFSLIVLGNVIGAYNEASTKEKLRRRRKVT